MADRTTALMVHQFLKEQKYSRTLHMFEMESGYYFNMQYLEEMVTNGQWEQVFQYLEAFTSFEDNKFIFLQIHLHKFLEALARNDRIDASRILFNDLNVLSEINQAYHTQLVSVLSLDNFRESPMYSNYKDSKTARIRLLRKVKYLIGKDDVLRNKVSYLSANFPRVKTLISESLKNPSSRPRPEPVPLLSVVPKPQPGSPHLGAHGAAPALLPPNLARHPLEPIGFPTSVLKRKQTPASTPPSDYPTTDEQAFKRTRVNHPPANVLRVGVSGQSRVQSSYSADDLPKTEVMTLDLMSSSVTSMDFHPMRQDRLLVGTDKGEIMIWDLRSRQTLVKNDFKVSNIDSYSMSLQRTLTNDYTASTSRVTWTPEGKLFGVSFSKNLVQIYAYDGGGDVQNLLEFEAHDGSVNDLAFAYVKDILSIVTFGDDKLIKVWDAVTGAMQKKFEGHKTPVYSVCPRFKEKVQFVVSTDISGKVKTFLYDNLGPRMQYTTAMRKFDESLNEYCSAFLFRRGRSSMKFAYSADRTRLFSCGTNTGGESFIVEWQESDGCFVRRYKGLGHQTIGVPHFDTIKNRFLAAGDEGQVKFWDMDSTDLLTTTTVDSEGGLLTTPLVRISKDGMLLAVSIHANGIKILANPDGVSLLGTNGVASAPVAKTPAMTTFGTASASHGPSTTDQTPSMPPMTLMKFENRNLVERPRIGDEVIDNSGVWKLTQISEPSECLSSTLPDNTPSSMRVTNLVYTNSGQGVLALVANAIHKLWKWPKNDCKTSAKLWEPTRGLLMTNDTSDANTEDYIPCFSLSKNDAYVISASGGKISLFNMMNFKTMATFMPPPPPATSLAFHPLDNNIVAIGMDDASVRIYNVRLDEVMFKLKGHQKRITGLAFSEVLGVLVSSGADAMFVWDLNGYKKKRSKEFPIPGGRVAARSADTRVQFDKDQTQLLVVHETRIGVFEAAGLECLKQWGPGEENGLITAASYSCDGQSIYVTLEDGSIYILTASTLRLCCRISPTAYLPSNPNTRVYPLVVAAHPSKPNQLALGLTDGGVCVIEPLETEGKWGTSAGLESVAGPSTTEKI